jgi:hypothetical protein
MQDNFDDSITAAVKPTPEDLDYWDAKFGQYVDGSLGLAQMQSIVDGWLTWPDYGPDYSGLDVKFAWIEPMEGV